MSDIREKIMAIEPGLRELYCCNKQQVFQLGLQRAADIAEDEVALLRAALRNALDVLEEVTEDMDLINADAKRIDEAITVADELLR